MIEAITPDKITRAQNGDAGVISELYERYHQGIFRYLYYCVGDLQTAEDLTSDVFVRMLRSIQHYEVKQASFDAWIFQIARNLAIDHHRRKKQQNHLHLEDVHLQEPSLDNIHNDSRLDSQILMQALNQLNDAQRDVIILRFINQVPLSQAANLLRKSEDSVKALQRRGLAALRQILSGMEI